MMFQRFMAVVAILCLVASVSYATSTIDVRLNHNSYNKVDKTLYVDIDVRIDNQNRMVLAGQNYRIFYPSATLSLDQKGSKSQLSQEKYSKLQFSGILENVSARGQGGIDFDANLGFANLSVELLDNQNGGESLSENDGWITIATLRFDVLGEFEEVSMIWGREGKSETYATAFVEIAEWKAPQQTSTVEIDEYFDFNLKVNSLSLEGITYDISVGPNPSSDFIEIKSDKALNTDMEVVIRDLSGRLIRTDQLQKGSKAYTIDVSNLLSASYILDMRDINGKALLSQKIIVAQ